MQWGATAVEWLTKYVGIISLSLAVLLGLLNLKTTMANARWLYYSFVNPVRSQAVSMEIEIIHLGLAVFAMRQSSALPFHFHAKLIRMVAECAILVVVGIVAVTVSLFEASRLPIPTAITPWSSPELKAVVMAAMVIAAMFVVSEVDVVSARRTAKYMRGDFTDVTGRLKEAEEVLRKHKTDAKPKDVERLVDACGRVAALTRWITENAEPTLWEIVKQNEPNDLA